MNREKLLKTAKPILFSTEMVKAIQDGRKMQTRRVVDNDWIQSEKMPISTHECKSVWHFWHSGEHKSKYKKGDVLYVRETFWAKHDSDCWDSGQSFDCGVDLKEDDFEIQYVASPVDKNQPDIPVDCYPTHTDENGDLAGCVYGEWQYYSKHPSIHMPKKYARLFLKVTNVRVERLQDMTVNDAEDEGMMIFGFDHKDRENHCKIKNAISNPEKIVLDAWVKVWNSTSKDGYKWEDNPFVFVYEFEVMT